MLEFLLAGYFVASNIEIDRRIPDEFYEQGMREPDMRDGVTDQFLGKAGRMLREMAPILIRNGLSFSDAVSRLESVDIPPEDREALLEIMRKYLDGEESI